MQSEDDTKGCTMSNAKIYVTSEDVWDFYEDNRAELKTKMVELASCDNTSVFITDEDGMPKLIVEMDEKEVENVRTPCASFELRYFTEALYDEYITFPTDNDTDIKEADDKEIDAFDEAIARDDELCCAMDDFLTVALDEDTFTLLLNKMGYDIHRLILSDICQMFKTNYGVDIYWPIIDDQETTSTAE